MGITVTVRAKENSVVFTTRAHIESMCGQVVDTCWCVSDQTRCMMVIAGDLRPHSQPRMQPVSVKCSCKWKMP